MAWLTTSASASFMHLAISSSYHSLLLSSEEDPIVLTPSLQEFLSSDDVFSATTHYTYEQKGCSRNETEEHESMEERIGEAFADTEQLTVMGRQLHTGEAAPNFCLDYLDLADLAVRTISLVDSKGWYVCSTW